MYTSAHIGALQQIGFPLRQTINEGDYDQWQEALKDPAAAADFIVAIDGDPVADAVKEHPQNLELMFVICSTGQPCARLYRSTSTEFGAVGYAGQINATCSLRKRKRLGEETSRRAF